ncbi:MAG: RluA family pseudouridine synthase [Spirochaetaceae bacterium]|jgi:RluA family pseudouridine synthase|nr:RluA family pseudouridine synthase [Spirochaetaceae bacterium]
MKKTPPFSILYEDDNVIAVNKSSGLSVGGDRWDASQERLDKLLEAYTGTVRHLYAVHRLDKETSGVVVFAKNAQTHKSLCAAFEKREVGKTYLVIVHGKPAWRETTCELRLVPDGNKKHQTIIDMVRGKRAVTRFTALSCAGNYTALRAEPETGRTHQIRVSLAWMRHPVVCDELYGSGKPLMLSAVKHGWHGDKITERPLLARLGLHAAELHLPSLPVFKAPFPRDIKAVLHQFEKNGVTL